ncbi:MAG TPA: hypothetical protein VGM52_04555, partial [Herbaspirillum sp.]
MNAIRLFLLSVIKSSAPRRCTASFAVALLAPLMLAATAFASPPPLPPMGGGTLASQAEVVFYIDGDAAQQRVTSNIVSVEIAAIRVLAFDHAAEVQVQAGHAFSVPVALLNKGNVETSYQLRLNGDAANMLALFPDVDGNGRKHDGAVAIDLSQARYMDYAGTDALLLSGVVPADAAEGSRYSVMIDAVFPDSAIAVKTSLTLVVSAAAQLSVTLEASRRTLDVSDQTTVTARIVNSGKQALASGKAVQIDGRAKNVTLLRYRIPEGMRYISGRAGQTDGDSSALLFAEAGDPDFQYRTALASDKVSEIAIAVRTALDPLQSRQMTFVLQRKKEVAGAKAASQILSRAEGHDSDAAQFEISNLLTFNLAGNTSPDILPTIRQSDTGGADASTGIEIGVKNIGVSATDGMIVVRGEVSASLSAGDIGGAGWQCTVRRTASGSAFQCSSARALPAGGSMPPVLLKVMRDSDDAAAFAENSCGADRNVNVVVSVPNEAQDLRGNNRAEAALLCKGGAVISGRAWIDASADGVYNRGEEVLSGWRAQLLRGGQVVGEEVTDQQGQYRIAGVLPDAGYSLRFLSPQGRIEALPLDGSGGGVAAAASASRPAYDFAKGTLVYPGVLSAREYPQQNLALLPTGTLFNKLTGQPLANVKVSLAGPAAFVARSHLVGASGNATTTTDAQGRFNFLLTPDAPAGLYRWQLDATGYEVPRDQDMLNLAETAAAGDVNRAPSVYKVFDSPAIPASSGDAAADPTARSNGYFSVTRVQGAKRVVNNHLGLAPLLAGGELSLQKTADRKTVE